MSFRLEEKIELHISDYLKILFLIKKNGGNEIFKERKISSLYFDNKNYDMFLDSEEGVLPRKKIRIRNYPEEKKSSFYHEKKISSVEGKFKTSEIISLSKKNKFLEQGIFDNDYGLCFQNIWVSYKRRYFKIGNNRITIDSNIFFQNPNKKLSYLADKILIVEIKSNNPYVKEIFNNEIPYQRSRYSKYCIGINFLYNKNHFQRLIK